MIDIINADPGLDLGIYDTVAPRAANLLSIQEGFLEYAPDWGIDLAYFIADDFLFQNASFKAYLIERLANRGINVASVLEQVQALFEQYTLELPSGESSNGLVAR